MIINFKQITCELIKALRGEVSRSALARRLHTGVENVTRWENGSRRISWFDFAQVCDVLGRPLSPSLTKIFSFKGDPADGATLTSRLLGASKLTHIAKETGISRFTLMRWQQHKSGPSVVEVLQIMHHCQYMMLEFIANFIDITTIPTAFGEYNKRQQRKEIYFEMPFVAALLCCLKLDEYKDFPRHVDGYIAGKIDISIAEERKALKRLVEIGKIVHNGKHFTAIDEQLELTDSDSFRKFSTYWLRRAADYSEQMQSASPIIGYGMDVHPTSSETHKALRDEYCAFYKRVRTLLQQDTGPKDSVYIFQSLFFDLDKRLEETERLFSARNADG
jgi:transcriptional regulator with XRE-family HTH domain